MRNISECSNNNKSGTSIRGGGTKVTLTSRPTPPPPPKQPGNK